MGAPQEEMARHQLTLLSRRLGRTLNASSRTRPRTAYEQPLTPFVRPDGQPYTPADAFGDPSVALGYTYDALPAVPAGQALTEPPTLAVFNVRRALVCSAGREQGRERLPTASTCASMHSLRGRRRLM